MIDNSLTLFLNNLLPHSWFLDQLFLFASWVGTYGAVWIAGAILMVLFEMVHHNTRFIRHFAISMIVCWLLVVGIKDVIKRPRPFNNPIMVSRLSASRLQSKRPTDYSFPSGHAALAFCGATIIFLHLIQNSKHEIRNTKQKNSNSKPRKIVGGWGLFVGCYLVAAIIAFSRIYLGVHYAGDVVAGVGMGITIAIITNFKA